MKRLLTLRLLFLLLIVGAIYATTFVKQVAIVGTAPRRLSTLLTNANYTGSSGVLELNVCNPTDAAGTLYVGSNSNVNSTTGARLDQGDCIRFVATGVSGDIGVKTDELYLLTNANQNAEVWLRTK